MMDERSLPPWEEQFGPTFRGMESGYVDIGVPLAAIDQYARKIRAIWEKNGVDWSNSWLRFGVLMGWIIALEHLKPQLESKIDSISMAARQATEALVEQLESFGVVLSDAWLTEAERKRMRLDP